MATPKAVEPVDIAKEKAAGTELASLEEQLRAYNAAVEGQFEEAIKDAQSAAELEEATKAVFRANGPIAAARIVFLAQYASSDAVQLSAAKHILEQGFSADSDNDSPLAKIIREMKKKPEPTDAELAS